ncbi:YaaR family protein [Spirochaeta cellobiosiphila]|uniref:YaaR family protein n=1 Tax=Spirochaeta cellobiosiphila TaxID=504483 RepID=UPI0004282DA0|nr:DUF327 family protein [Spirochaeta cellobiosiphila]
MEGIDQLGASGIPQQFIDKKTQKSEKKKHIFKSTLDKRLHEADGAASDIKAGAIDEIELLLDEVHDVGEALANEPNMSNIKRYKEAISRFLKTINLHNFTVEEQEGVLNRNFSRKKYFQVKILNEKLDRLVAGVIQNQSGQLEILHRVEEIQGLLVDLLS